MPFYDGKYLLLNITVALLCSCAAQASDLVPVSSAQGESVRIQDLDITSGQTVDAPAYVQIYYTSDGRVLALTVTLTIHNTDADHPIVITSVRYYDAQGQLVKEYLSEPRRLAPLSAADFLVDVAGQSREVEANFLVEWVAEQPVYEPIVETVMINTEGTQGISFISPGRVIKQLD
ncbi:MAG: DUF3124 domain-containing protein [Caldilineaceae bacterium]|nr:DUF3124 domain-containing protein [Caldilineaceae bacterium]MCB0140729.1 DUF3124 domain-containing protein [Caldilineaceae bacterium]